MKIILGGADFSANNIGQVEVPIDYEAETLAYFDEIPTAFAAMSFTLKAGINNFVKGLKSNALLNKTGHRVYFPQFGQSEGAINLIDPEQTPLNLPAASASIIYDENGLTLNGASFQSSFSFPWFNFFAGFINKTNTGDYGGERSFFLERSGGAGVGREVTNNQSGLVISATERVLIANRVTSNGYVLGTYGSNGTNADQQGGRTIIDGEYNADADVSGGLTSAPIHFGGNTGNAWGGNPKHSVSVIVLGEQALTQTETQAYGALLNNLYEVI